MTVTKSPDTGMDHLHTTRADLRSQLKVLPPGDARNNAEMQLRKVEGNIRRRHLPLLGRIRVASPCPETFSTMEGSEQKRFCKLCDKDVHNLSAMTRADAEAFLQSAKGNGVCVTFFRRRDGGIMTSDCGPGASKRRRRRRRAALIGAGVVVAGGTAACSSGQQHEFEREVGEIEVAVQQEDPVHAGTPNHDTHSAGLETPSSGEEPITGEPSYDVDAMELGEMMLLEEDGKPAAHDHGPDESCHHGCAGGLASPEAAPEEEPPTPILRGDHS